MSARTPRHRIATSRTIRVLALVPSLLLIPGFAPRTAPAGAHCTGGASGAACSSCHDFEPGRTHPVDIVPGLAVPTDLPLERGRMTCTTCHDPESGLEGQLRYSNERGGDLCTACHDQRGADRVDAHALATRRAHLDSDPRRPQLLSEDLRPDLESADCLGCHDGALARGDMFRLGSAPRPGSARFIDGQHPIGVRQGPRWARDNLIPADRIDPAIRLVDGRLGCGSCHAPYSRFDNLLVMSNERSRLCLSCHDF